MRIGVDIGGTFTDIVAIGGDGRVLSRKVSSTPADYARGIVAALADLAREEALSTAKIGSILHGTTVATNAILEKRGARTGLLTTEGFRDVLEIRRLRMPELYNLLYEKPPPLVERYLRREVPERVGARGEVLRALDEERLRAELAYLVHEGVESIAVSFLNSYANAEHEVRAGRIISELAPEVLCSLSSDVLPEVREYERTSTTVINAYVRPIVDRYLRSLLRGIQEIGVRAPVRIMQSNGGIQSARSAMLRPVHLVESGPAAGVVAARLLAARAGVPSAIAFDMGGTTAKASLIEEGRTRVTSEFEVGARLSAQGLNLAGPALRIAQVLIHQRQSFQFLCYRFVITAGGFKPYYAGPRRLAGNSVAS